MQFITRTAAAAVCGGALMAAAPYAVLTAGAAQASAVPGGKAAAAQSRKITVQPDPAVARQRVRVSDGDRCASATGIASSMAFSAPAALRPASGGQLAGGTSIRSGALGTYPVIVACGRKEISGSVRVVRKPALVRSHKPGPVSPKGPAPAPKGAAPAGDGTTSISSRRYDAAMAKTGLAIAGLGAVAGLVARRRRSRSRT